MGDKFNLYDDGCKCDKDRKDKNCKVTITVNCCEKKSCCDADKHPPKDKGGCEVDVVINCCC